MKKNIFLLLFLALYSITVLSQSLPTKIFKVDYFGNKTLLLTGEADSVEVREIERFLLQVDKFLNESDSLEQSLFLKNKDTLFFNKITLITTSDVKTLYYKIFSTEDIGLVDFDGDISVNNFDLFLEIKTSKEVEVSDFLPSEQLTEENLFKTRLLLENISLKIIYSDLTK